jgi:predicted RNA-binding protein (virulence factor B family)
MIKIGDYNELQVIEKVDFGVYLGSPEDKILLPKKYANEGTEIGDNVRVFIYRDSEDRIIATTLSPKAKVGEFAYLEVKEVNSFGAFLDWGLEKDLFVPFREQKMPMEQYKSYVVYIYLDDKTGRIAATTKISKYLNATPIDVSEGDEVNLLVYKFIDIGAAVIVNNKFSGMVYKNDIYQDINIGDSLKGYVFKIREDEKLDIIIRKRDYEKVLDSEEILINMLKENNGYLPYHDKSLAEVIEKNLHMSKGTFKKAIGGLYKINLIEFMDDGIKLK